MKCEGEEEEEEKRLGARNDDDNDDDDASSNVKMFHSNGSFSGWIWFGFSLFFQFRLSKLVSMSILYLACDLES